MMKQWSEPLVLKLVKRHRGSEPEEILERAAAELLKDADQDKLPIDVDLIASAIGIRKRTGLYDFAGRIYAEPSGQLVMDINIGDSAARQRFTCAHELMHSVFPGFKREARYRIDDETEEHERNREEEYLCDVGAAALLMPKALVKEEYPVENGLRALERLASDADVSCEAAGNRMVTLAGAEVAFLVFELGHKPADRPALQRGESVEPQLRLRYARRSPDLDIYLPRFKSARHKSVFDRAFADRGIIQGLELLPGAERSGPFEIEAKAYGTSRRRRVLAIARPSST